MIERREEMDHFTVNGFSGQGRKKGTVTIFSQDGIPVEVWMAHNDHPGRGRIWVRTVDRLSSRSVLSWPYQFSSAINLMIEAATKEAISMQPLETVKTDLQRLFERAASAVEEEVQESNPSAVSLVQIEKEMESFIRGITPKTARILRADAANRTLTQKELARRLGYTTGQALTRHFNAAWRVMRKLPTLSMLNPVEAIRMIDQRRPDLFPDGSDVLRHEGRTSPSAGGRSIGHRATGRKETEMSEGVAVKAGRLTKVQKEVGQAIARLWPWLPSLDSMGEHWVWTRKKTLECGYGKGGDHVLGCVGFEDAVDLFEEEDRFYMVEECDVLQAEINRLGLPYWLEPHYSFLWVIFRKEATDA